MRNALAHFGRSGRRVVSAFIATPFAHAPALDGHGGAGNERQLGITDVSETRNRGCLGGIASIASRAAQRGSQDITIRKCGRAGSVDRFDIRGEFE